MAPACRAQLQLLVRDGHDAGRRVAGDGQHTSTSSWCERGAAQGSVCGCEGSELTHPLLALENAVAGTAATEGAIMKLLSEASCDIPKLWPISCAAVAAMWVRDNDVAWTIEPERSEEHIALIPARPIVDPRKSLPLKSMALSTAPPKVATSAARLAPTHPVKSLSIALSSISEALVERGEQDPCCV